MTKTLIHGSDFDTETSLRLAQLVLDGYGDEEAIGLVMKNGDNGPTTFVISAADGHIDQISDGYVSLRGFVSVKNNAEICGNFTSNKLPEGQQLDIKTISILVNIPIAKQFEALLIPANVEVIGISSYVVTCPTGTSYMSIGVLGSKLSEKRYGCEISTHVGSSHTGIESAGISYIVAVPVLITFDTVPSDTNGQIRLTIHYRSITPPSK